MLVFNGLGEGGYVSKGFTFEPPDLTNAEVSELNAYQDQLSLLLASLTEQQRLQIQYFCDSDYRKELLRYRMETDKATNEWTKLCRNGLNQIADCSSSLRYKTNIAPFSSGLSLIKRLRPISFDWKTGGPRDVGFGAEEVAAINPLFVTYNSKGQIEGVKYDLLGVAFVNAFKEQQSQIEQQRDQIKKQQNQIDALRKLVCLDHPNADVCK